MYAVFISGGKQYRAQAGDIVQIEKLPGEAGAVVNFDKILFTSKPNGDDSKITLGKPLLSGAVVKAEILAQGRGEKVIITKMKRRKQYRRTKGHRQDQTQVLIMALDNGAGDKVELSAEDKKLTLSKFYTDLTPRGLAAKTKATKAQKLAAGAKDAAPKAAKAKTAAKKTAAKKA